MNNPNILNPKKLLVIIVIFFSSQVLIAEPNGLELTLSKKEQSLLDSFEQKNQADSLIKLLETLEKLSDYPTEAIDELTGKNPNHQVINRVVKRLKQAKDKSTNSLEPLNFDSQKNSLTDAGKAKQSQLIPVLATASSDNGISAGKVIFKNTEGVSIPAYEKQPFVYNGNNYELLSVTPIADSEGQFSILLKTPTSTQQYIWPR
jgi:hypothetical protein